MYWVYLERRFLSNVVYKMLIAAAPARARRAAPSIPKRAAAPVFWGAPARALVADAACEARLPAAAVPEAMLVCIPELAAAEVLDATDALALALAEADALAVALAPPLSSEAPSTTVAEMKATSLPDKTAVCVS